MLAVGGPVVEFRQDKIRLDREENWQKEFQEEEEKARTGCLAVEISIPTDCTPLWHTRKK